MRSETNSTGAADVKHERTSRADFYTGTKTALIGAGHAREGQFPGDPGRPKTSCSYDRDGIALCKCSRSGWSNICRRGKMFRVLIRVDQEQEERRRADEGAERERSEEAANAKLSLRDLPSSEDEFRRGVATKLRDFVRTFVPVFCDAGKHFHGYTIDAEPVMMSIDALIEAVMRADVHFDEQRHKRFELALRAQVAAGDGSFVQSLAKLTKVDPALVEGIES